MTSGIEKYVRYCNMKISFIREMAVTIVLLSFMTGISGAEHACITDDGTAFFCGDTVTASCMLTGDMTCQTTGCGLVIGADNITIDGAGHAPLLCSGVCRRNLTFRF